MASAVSNLAATWKQTDQNNVEAQLEAQGKSRNYFFVLQWGLPKRTDFKFRYVIADKNLLLRPVLLDGLHRNC